MVEGGRPRIDGEDIPAIGIIDHQYKNARPFSDYLILMLAPLLNQIQLPVALFVALTAIGYSGARWVDRQFSPASKPRSTSRRAATWLWIVLPVVAFILIAGIMPNGPLQFSDSQLWGGLLLTMLLTAVGIVGAFPIGIALALGRRSSLPVVSTFSTLYIEVVRGVPLVTVLFMSMLLVPFVIPSLGGPDTAPYRAMVAVTLFSAAYLAENVRGGLQSLPPGQEEAAKALGLAGWQITLYITLPQALRAVIPALVGQFISLYKDTSLVAIVGLIDLTGVTKNVAAQTEFQSLLRETYVFISVIYFIFSYVMSVVSRRIEASGSGAARRV
ncbi:MAG: amino acid ABC transporter permease [Anaerolineae bacterium]|nr:amino acid ABC transporter permease [Anaerolineae bacterium]